MPALKTKGDEPAACKKCGGAPRGYCVACGRVAQ